MRPADDAAEMQMARSRNSPKFEMFASFRFSSSCYFFTLLMIFPIY